jgi:hypothetical protein
MCDLYNDTVLKETFKDDNDDDDDDDDYYYYYFVPATVEIAQWKEGGRNVC